MYYRTRDGQISRIPVSGTREFGLNRENSHSWVSVYPRLDSWLRFSTNHEKCIESESESFGWKIRAAKLRLCFSAPENTVQYWWSCRQCAHRILATVFYEILLEKYMRDACCSAECFQFVIRNLKNPQTAIRVRWIQPNELQLLGTGIREFLTTSTSSTVR